MWFCSAEGIYLTLRFTFAQIEAQKQLDEVVCVKNTAISLEDFGCHGYSNDHIVKGPQQPISDCHH